MSSLREFFLGTLVAAVLMTGASAQAQSWVPGTNSSLNCASPCNVGISTSAPGATLDVFGGRVRASYASGYGEMFAGSYGGVSAFHFVAGSGLGLSFAANGQTPQMYIDGSGNLGIGTTAPSAKLHVNGVTRLQDRIEVRTSGNNTWATPGYYLGNANGDYIGMTMSAESPAGSGNYNLDFWGTQPGGPSRVMTLTSSGKLGLNNASPTAALHISPVATNLIGLNVKLYEYATLGTTSGSWATVLGSNVKASETTTSQMESISNIAGFGGAAIYMSNDGWILFHTKPSPVTAGAAFNSPRMTILPNGNIGMGLTVPVTPLHLSANPSGGSGAFSGNPNSTIITRIDSSYNDNNQADTAPITPLAINCAVGGGGDTAKCGLQLSTANNLSIGTRLLTALKNNGTGASSFYVQNFDGAAFQTRMVVDPTGNVGIGTTAPAQKLSVAGTIESTSGGIKFPDGTVQTSASAGGFSNTGTAITVTTPKLEVSGAIKGNRHMGFMPWANGANVPSYGYLKLKTAIADHESNLFQLHIYGYRYMGPAIQSIDIRCSGYAYDVSGLVNTACTTTGTDLPVEINTEANGATSYVVVRIGAPTTYWYYPHFSVEYDGTVAKEPSTFTWVAENTIPAGSAPVSNMNNVAIANNDGGSLIVGRTAGDSTTRLTVNGGITTNGNLTASTITAGTVIGAVYQDVAEWVPATQKMDAGTVVVLNTSALNEVMPSFRTYDTTVAGVVSAQPGVLLGREGVGKAQIATTGRVKVHVDATRHAIHVGDLLVTSDKPGAAMVSEPLDLGGVKIHRPGTLIGKALEPLPSGEGDVLVLLSLQ
jgi:hypothetical protein